MSDNQQTYRLSKVAKEFNLSLSTIVDFLSAKGISIKPDPNGKIGDPEYKLLSKEYQGDKSAKEEAAHVAQIIREKKETIILDDSKLVTQKKKDDKEDNIIIKDLSAQSATDKVLENLKKEQREAIAEKIKAEEKEKAAKLEAEKKVEAEKKIEEPVKVEPTTVGPKVLGMVDLSTLNQKTKPDKKTKKEKEDEAKAKEEEKQTAKKKTTKSKKDEVVVPEVVKPVVEEVKEEKVEPTVKEEPKEDFLATKFQKLEGPKILGNIVLPVEKKPVSSSDNHGDKKKRKRIKKGVVSQETIKSVGKAVATAAKDRFNKPGEVRRGSGPIQRREAKPALTDEEIQAQIKETLARLSQTGSKSKASKYRKEKRSEIREKMQEEHDQAEADKSVLKVTEFISAAQLSQMMGVPVTKVISTCMQLGLFVSINQRLDAETIAIVAEEFGFKVEFVTVEAQESIKEEEDKPEDLLPRPPVVTVMGHVDHGKTSLLDFIRKANVIAGEAGGITQHIGAYNVTLENGKHITFLDTPGHEAFTAMRARGAKVTDVAIIVIAADDSIMPQTKEAITHAQAAGVPMVFAINKIDKPGANPEKIREALAAMNILVEEWGGKFQCQEVSAKQGKNMDLLLEKVLLEAEMLDLKANPKKRAVGTVIETKLDKGRGYEATVLVETGTLKVGDVILAGSFHGRVKALNNERGAKVQSAGPAIPVMVLGLNGAPQAGDKFYVLADEREARELATKRLQLQREQGMRARKHITLDEIGRRLAIGDFKELNVIVKGDVDGSVEALSDSLLKLSTEKVQVNIILKSVGAISESDVMLASASNAIIIGFQVRPTLNARKLAEAEEIDVRLYSIIYDAINELKAAMEGMLAPEFEEKITCNIEIREVFKITKVGTIAGCYVLDGKVNRHTKVRVIRDGIVIHTGGLGSLKRFKDDVKEVATGYECGLNIEGFNDIQVGDIIEGYEMVEVKAKL
ncbi:MAG: translation initiation factor IF-2 [Bacteroidota bacterium]|nr:translation initiation factor IF-2 [Bacteroidota bacterium]